MLSDFPFFCHRFHKCTSYIYESVHIRSHTNRVYVHIQTDCTFTYKQSVRSHINRVYVHIHAECTFTYKHSVRSHINRVYVHTNRVYVHIKKAAVTWLEYYRYGVKSKTINQSITYKNQCYSIVLGVSSVDHFSSNIPHVQIPNKGADFAHIFNFFIIKHFLRTKNWGFVIKNWFVKSKFRYHWEENTRFQNWSCVLWHEKATRVAQTILLWQFFHDLFIAKTSWVVLQMTKFSVIK